MVEKICALSHNEIFADKVYANLLVSRKRVNIKFLVDSCSTCSILPLNTYKQVIGDMDCVELNTERKISLCLYDNKTTLEALGTRKVFVRNPATNEKIIVQFRIVDGNFNPIIGSSDSQSQHHSWTLN